MKEEFKTTIYAAKRDIKYLKTNYSEYEYCLQTLRDYMMINYKFTFKEATEFINYMGLKIGKEGEVVLKNDIDVAKEKLIKIEEEEQYEQQIKEQGYTEGIAYAQAIMQQQEQEGDLPPELLQELAAMSDEELQEIISRYPELLDKLGQ